MKYARDIQKIAFGTTLLVILLEFGVLALRFSCTMPMLWHVLVLPVLVERY
jgi:hypothetical protein